MLGDLLTDQRQMLSELNKALAQVSQSDLFNVKFQSSAANSANSRLNTEVSGLNLPVNDTRTLVSEDVVDEIDLHTNRLVFCFFFPTKLRDKDRLFLQNFSNLLRVDERCEDSYVDRDCFSRKKFTLKFDFLHFDFFSSLVHFHC